MIFTRSILCFVFFAAISVRCDADSKQTYLDCMTNFETYAETLWTNASYAGAPPDAGYWGDGATTGNGGIRGNGGVAVLYAALCIAQPGDPKFTNRIARVRQALNYNAQTHLTGGFNAVNSTNWGWYSGAIGNCSTAGADWQTALWVSEMGLACELVQSNLPVATVSNVQRVVANEASHRATIAPCSGFKSDTKAEENGWDAVMLAQAAAWITNHVSATNWLLAAKQYLANTYTVADTAGDPLASWVTSTTLYGEFALENHGYFHTEYQYVAGEELGDAWIMARLADTNIAAQLTPFAEHNVLNVWSNIQHGLEFSGEVSFPASLDWALDSYGQNSFIAWLSTHFNDPVARWDDARVSAQERARQLVNGNGQFVGPSGGGFFREAVQAYRTAVSWLHWNYAENPTGVSSGIGDSFISMTDVGVIEQRGSNGLFSICYGPQTNGSAARIMAFIEPATTNMTNDVLTASPRCPGIIGIGSMGTMTGAKLVSIATNGNLFQAELKLTNANGRVEIYVNCTGENIGIVEVPWPAAGFTNQSGASFISGIQNAPLNGGTRLVEWSGSSAIVTNRSGISVNATGNWICVAGRYGVAAGPGGYFNYKAPTTYTRVTPVLNEAGTAEDALQFYPTNSLSPRYAVYFPGRTAAQVSNLASQISWNISGTNAVLIFPATNGTTAQITALIAASADLPSYPSYTLAITNVTGSSFQSATYSPTNAFDGNFSTFWVSYGTTQGQGPRTNAPEWLSANFTRPASVSGFQVYPRTNYGPTTIAMRFNGATNYSGTMSNAKLDVKLSPPVYATNAQLYITGSNDPSFPTNSRNVQVVELIFFERAQPGTFGDFLLQNFSDAQLTNSFYAATNGDPDADGAGNYDEFLAGTSPTNPASVLKLLMPAQAGTNFIVSWTTAGIRTNIVQISSGSPAGFADASGPIVISTPGDSTTNFTLPLPTNSAPFFYRVRLP